MSAKFRTVILALAALSFSSGLLAADDPMMGTWNLNVPKSQLGSVVPRSIVRKHIPVPGGVKVV